HRDLPSFPTRRSSDLNSRFYLFIRLERDEIVADPSYGGVTRSENVIVIEITLNAGRTLEVKKALYAGIASRLESAGVRPDDVVRSEEHTSELQSPCNL